MKPTLIVIIGRKWHSRRPGNAYHDVEIVVHCPGPKVIQHRANMVAGNGEEYVKLAAEWLQSKGLINLPMYPNGTAQTLCQYCQDNGIKLVQTEMNVASRNDLKGA